MPIKSPREKSRDRRKLATATGYGDGHLPAILWHSRHLIPWGDGDLNDIRPRPGLVSRRWPHRRGALDALSAAAVEWAARVDGVGAVADGASG